MVSKLNGKSINSQIVQSNHDFSDAKDRYTFYLGYSVETDESFLGDIY